MIPQELTPAQVAYTYANEADMLNVVLFGRTAKQWKDENSTDKENMRDVATLNQLLVPANLESYNAVLINQGKFLFRTQVKSTVEFEKEGYIRKTKKDCQYHCQPAY